MLPIRDYEGDVDDPAGGKGKSAGSGHELAELSRYRRAGDRKPGNDLYGNGGLLDPPERRPGISGTAYDTAWLASVPAAEDRRTSRFPASLKWLVENQMPDGSWGGEVRYEHDRVLCTLAALAPLAVFGRRAQDRLCVQDGTRYLWQHGHKLSHERIELVGFELVLPALVDRAKRAGIAVPPHLDVYGPQRAEKLSMIPAAALYSPRTTVVHSLEFLDEQVDVAGLHSAQGSNGSVGNSPAATAFFVSLTDDPQAVKYLEHCLDRSGGAMAPVLHPCETFELLWSAYHLFLAGVPADRLLNPSERIALRSALQNGGVSLSTTFPIPDADDTSVALILLNELGERVDASVLKAFELPDKHFVSFPYERHSSVGVNLHVLHALLRIPGYPDCAQVIDRLMEYLGDEQIDGLYWLDKWHISPYYATAHAICVFDEVPSEYERETKALVERSKEWVRQTQNSDGSWGFFGKPTAEETAYGILALTSGTPGTEHDLRRCLAGARYLESAIDGSREDGNDLFPPLWIDKCLYSPVLVVQAAIEASRRIASEYAYWARRQRKLRRNSR